MAEDQNMNNLQSPFQRDQRSLEPSNKRRPLRSDSPVKDDKNKLRQNVLKNHETLIRPDLKPKASF
jgi:hypothetical protein